MKRDGTHAETRFGLSAKRTSPFKFGGLGWGGGESVQSTTGSRGVRISGSNVSNAGYTMFGGRVQDYWLPTPLECASPCAIRFQLSSIRRLQSQEIQCCVGHGRLRPDLR